MPLERTNVVDAIAIEKTSRDVVLFLYDEADWDDLGEHLAALEAKLNVYLAFIEGGELAERFRDRELSGRVKIVVRTKFAIPWDAETFFAEVQRTLSAAGYEFETEHSP